MSPVFAFGSLTGSEVVLPDTGVDMSSVVGPDSRCCTITAS